MVSAMYNTVCKCLTSINRSVCVCLQGYVRFREEGGAQRAREGLLGRAVGGVGMAQLCGSGVELKVLEGQFWMLIVVCVSCTMLSSLKYCMYESVGMMLCIV